MLPKVFIDDFFPVGLEHMDTPEANTSHGDFTCTNVPSHDLCGGVDCKETSHGPPLIQKCVSTAQSTEYKGFGCWEGKLKPIDVTVPGNNTLSLGTGTITIFQRSISVFAPLIQLVHQRTDVTDSSTSTAGAEKKKGIHSSLSTGAKAGIGIGSVIGGFVLVGAIFLFWSRRRRNNRATNLAKGDSYVRNLQNYELSSR